MKNEDESKIKTMPDKEKSDISFFFIINAVLISIGLIVITLYSQGLLLINLAICFIYAIIPIFKKYHYRILLTALIIVHILLLLNVQGWNEGSMSGSYYYIELLKPISDLLYSLLLVSAFTFCLPLIFYILFLNSLAKLTHYLSNPDKFKLKKEIDKK